MKQLSLVSLLILSSLIAPVPAQRIESVAVVFANPMPQPSYKARSARSKPRQTLTLTQLPVKWQRLAWCESRHHLHAVNNDTYYGLWQIHKGWYKPFGINPETATLAQQYRVAQHVYKRQGRHAWTCSKYTGFK